MSKGPVVFSNRWWNNEREREASLAEGQVWPELTSNPGVQDWVIGDAYTATMLVYHLGSLYRANSNIAAGTAFVTGTGANEWTNVSQGLTVIPDYNPALTYAKDQPVFHNDGIWRAKVDGLTGPFATASWQLLVQSAIQPRVFMVASSPATLFTEARAGQEIYFEEPVAVGGFNFLTGDRVVIRQNLSGTVTENDFYYYAASHTSAPDVPPAVTDIVYTGVAGDNVNFFFVIDPETDIEVGVDITGKITWTPATSVPATGGIISIEWENDGDPYRQLVEGADYSLTNNNTFQILGTGGLLRQDKLKVTYRP